MQLNGMSFKTTVLDLVVGQIIGQKIISLLKGESKKINQAG